MLKRKKGWADDDKQTVAGTAIEKRGGSGCQINNARFDRSIATGVAAPLSKRPARTGRKEHDALIDLAKDCAIQPEYLDMKGRVQRASPEALKALLGFWDLNVGTAEEARDALCQRAISRSKRVLEPVTIVWGGREWRLKVRVNREMTATPGSCRIQLEDGKEALFSIQFDGGGDEAVHRIEGTDVFVREFKIPGVPYGYHKLTLEAGGNSYSTMVISAPTRTFQSGGPKSWGGFLPMYATHSRNSWGAGNVSDWRAFADVVANNEGKVIATLPLTATFLGPSRCVESPYSPASRLFWNEFYIDVEQAPEFRECHTARKAVQSARFQRALAGFRRSGLIDYPAQAQARREVLELLSKYLAQSKTPRFKQMQAWIRERPIVESYARFRAVCDRTDKAWNEWEPRLKHGRLQPGDYDPAACQYYLYSQWIIDQQIEQFEHFCERRGLRTYFDLPVGVHRASFDVWHEQRVFAAAASVGAPPDVFFTNGQNWDFAPLHPERIREQGYKYVIDYLRFQMHSADMLRIDHVMGFHRLFWIPPGFSGLDGAYVHYRSDEWLAILCLESHRNRTRIIGENLGIVPPEVNESMQRHGLGSMYVMQFEQREAAKEALRTPPSSVVASVNTHDTPTFAAHWAGADLKQRLEIKILDKTDVKRELARRQKLKSALLNFLVKQGCLRKGSEDAESVLAASLRWLAGSPAETLLVNFEDLWGELQPQNVPGTTRECKNWRRKTALSVEEIQKSEKIRGLLKEMADMRREAQAVGVSSPSGAAAKKGKANPG
jgi:4-alpha-glucanotransferase